MATILDRIVERKRLDVAAAQSRVSEAELERRCRDLPPCRGFRAALDHPGEVRVIAEVKKASPSAGVIRDDFDPVAIARAYERHGAACLSVLTDEGFFQGHLDHLRAVRESVGLPLLRKDFVLTRYQLFEARAAGADAALLIAEILPGDELAELHAAARDLGWDVLVELHDAEHLPRVLAAGATLVGVNNRDLRTFVTQLEQTIDLLPRIPPDVLVVSESGICTPADVRRLGDAGARAILVGESLMRQPDVGVALDLLRGISRPNA